MLVCEWNSVPAFDLWDVVMDVFLSSNAPPTQKISTPKSKPRGAAGNCVRDNVHNIRLRKEGDRNVDQLSKSCSCDHKRTFFSGQSPAVHFLKTTKQ